MQSIYMIMTSPAGWDWIIVMDFPFLKLITSTQLCLE